MNSVLSAFFKFVSAFSMLQISSSYLYKHREWIWKTKCNTKRTHISATCYSWNTCSNNRFSFCFSLKTKSQTNIWLIVWKSCPLVLKQILGWAFWSSENIESFLKSGLHTRLHTSNENLDFLAELYISSFFFEIFHWT